MLPAERDRQSIEKQRETAPATESDKRAESARFKHLADRLQTGFHPAHPHSSRQRGANERTNKPFGQHIPGKKSLLIGTNNTIDKKDRASTEGRESFEPAYAEKEIRCISAKPRCSQHLNPHWNLRFIFYLLFSLSRLFFFIFVA